MTLGTPTMPCDEPTGRYVLSTKPSRPIAPRDGLERLERVLAKPVWSQADRDRMERALIGLWEHWNRACDAKPIWVKHPCTDSDCRECAMIERIHKRTDEQIKEWDRIRQAPPIPSTAQLRNAFRRPDRTVRAARLYRDLMDRLSARRRIVLATVKPCKTYAVRLKHERKAEEADPTLRRLNRAINRLQVIQPDVAYLARTLH